jgi:hypothetical protein
MPSEIDINVEKASSPFWERISYGWRSNMGTEAPDPKTFPSWEEAFEYPIPTVRAMEKQLRREIDSNRQKLRTLVG